MLTPLTRCLRAIRLRLILLLPIRWRSAVLFPPGHFYSPLPDFWRYDRVAGRFEGDDESTWENIDLDESGQRETYQQLLAQTRPLCFPERATAGFRYHTDNDMFVYGDAFVLSGMLQQRQPRRVIEIGSGFSSAVMLDTADACALETQFTFIEIRPQRLQRLLLAHDTARVTIKTEPVQDIEPTNFDTLGTGDILFIDSSHVAKVGSDVVFLLLRVLPHLAAGVYIHIHDIFYPESYPARWMLEGRAWNESLFLRAFLAHNRDFRIRAFNAFAARAFPELFVQRLPRFLTNSGGSLWLEKVG